MAADDTSNASAPFEGPEKLLEIWFAPSPDHVPDACAAQDSRTGLRRVPRFVWEDMLDIVKCKILSAVHGAEMDAYLLSESSFFVSPHRLILKTCGTTLNLLGLPRILAIAHAHAGLSVVHRCFYSRKAFMFPERQLGPHRDWQAEVRFLDAIFPNGSAYTVGKVNGDHWLLYMSAPPIGSTPGSSVAASPVQSLRLLPEDRARAIDIDRDSTTMCTNSGFEQSPTVDYTIEILMTHLAPEARALFFTPPGMDDPDGVAAHQHGQALSSAIGISALFPPHLTTLDAYAFSPCGYSSNALLKWGVDGPGGGGEGYYTIHVTPEEGWSYASFECNVPLSHAHQGNAVDPNAIPDLRTLVRRVVSIFRPGTITLTLFVSSEDADDEGEMASAVEEAQRAFKAALTRPLFVPAAPTPADIDDCAKADVGNDTCGPKNGHGPAYGAGKPERRVYKRTDKINYEFGGYDLAFASFELSS